MPKNSAYHSGVSEWEHRERSRPSMSIKLVAPAMPELPTTKDRYALKTLAALDKR